MTLDMSYFREVAGTDDKLFGDLVNLMRSELEENRNELVHSIEKEDYENSSRMVHTLKNKFGIFRNSDMAYHTTRVKQSLDSGVLVREDIDKILKEIDQILKLL